MNSATLVAFLFKVPLEVRTVELYGSWDDFANGCPLQLDIYNGSGNWTLIPCFPRIMNDGNQTIMSQPRSVVLKQGRRYWYYYKLDDEVEVCDSSKPTTTSYLPLLDQVLNVVDVPYEPSQRCSWEASASISSLSPHLPYSSAGLFKRLKTTHLTTQSSSDDTLFQNAAKERLRHHDPVLKVEVWRKHERGQGDPVRTLQQPDIGPTESVQSHLSALNDGFFVSHATSNDLDRPSTRHGIFSDASKTFQSQAWPLLQTSRY